MTEEADGARVGPGSRQGEVPRGRTYREIGPKVWILGGLMIGIGIVTAILMLQDFRSRSYLYLAFYAIPSNTAISAFPHEPVLVYYGKFADLWITAGAATAGTLVAAYLDHSVFVPLLNLKGLQGYKEKKLYRTSIELFDRWPFVTLVVAAFMPVPFWPFKILTFSIHYPLRRYMAAVALARYPRYVLLAWIGAAFDVPNWILFAIFGVVVATYLVRAGPELWRKARAPSPGDVPGNDVGSEEMTERNA